MSYNNSGIRIFQGTITSDDVINSNVTIVPLLAAPGAGLVNYLIASFFNVKVGATPYTNMGNVWLIYGATPNDQTNLASPFLFNQFNSGVENTNYIFGNGAAIGSDWLGGTTGTVNLVASSIAINSAISFTGSNGGTDGSGTVDYTIWYATVKCA